MWPLVGRAAAAVGDRRLVGDERARARRAHRRLDRLQRRRRRSRSCARRERADVAGRRLLLVGGEAAALLFAFAVLAARGDAPRSRGGAAPAHLVRRTTLAAPAPDRVRERRRGARRRRRRLVPRPRRRGPRRSRAGAPVGRRAPGERALPRLGSRSSSRARDVVVAAATSVTGARPTPHRRRSRLRSRPSRVVVAAARGGAADEEQLARGEGIGARPAPSARSDRVRGRRRGARVFSVRSCGSRARPAQRRPTRRSRARARPRRGAVTVAFLTLAFALALLAEGYRATLVQAESDQAAFEVPLDVVVREDLQSLVPVFDAASDAASPARRQGGGACPVLRLTRQRGRGGARERRDGARL